MHLFQTDGAGWLARAGPGLKEESDQHLSWRASDLLLTSGSVLRDIEVWKTKDDEQISHLACGLERL